MWRFFMEISLFVPSLVNRGRGCDKVMIFYVGIEVFSFKVSMLLERDEWRGQRTVQLTITCQMEIQEVHGIAADSVQLM